jgi:hypothetical protein
VLAPPELLRKTRCKLCIAVKQLAALQPVKQDTERGEVAERYKFAACGQERDDDGHH